MQKRLFGILASVAVIVAACGGATTSSAPAGVDRARASAAPAVTPAPSVSRPRRRADPQHRPRPGAPDPRPEQGAGLDLDRGPPRPPPPASSTSTRTSRSCPSWRGVPTVSADAKTMTFTPEGRRSTATATRSSPVTSCTAEAPGRSANRGAVLLRHGRDRGRAPSCSALARLRTRSAADAEIDAALDKLGVSAPDDKTSSSTLTKPATYFLRRHGPVDRASRSRRSGSPARTRPRPANYVGSGPFILDTWKHNSEIVLKPNPNWYGDVKPTLTEIDMSMTAEPAQAPGGLRGRRARHGPDPERGHPARQGRSGARPDGRRDPAARDHLLHLQQRQDPTGKPLGGAGPEGGPTANKDFRIALTQAIDKKAFIDATFAGVGEPANSFVMPGIPGYQRTSIRIRSISRRPRSTWPRRSRARRTDAAATSAS